MFPSLFGVSLSEQFLEGLLLWSPSVIVLQSREVMTNWMKGPLLTPRVPVVLCTGSFLQHLYAWQAWGCRCLHEEQRNLIAHTGKEVLVCAREF